MYNYWEKHNKQLEQLDQKKRDIILQADNAWEAYESERDPQQKPTLKTIWQQLLSEEDDIIDEHCRIRREWQMLEGGGAYTSNRVRNEDLTEFWRELRSATTDEASGIMQLPDMPAELAAFMPRLQGLYVRDCYVQLTDLVVVGTHKDTLVTGAHGTGKACWQLHLLQRLARLRRTVVLDWANSDNRLLFCPEGAFVGSKALFKEELLNPDNFYLVNGKLPVGALARRVETCPPQHSLQWSFIKNGADMRVMPPWTLQELEAALPLFPDVSQARLHELYTLWGGGGTVRWTLARASRGTNEKYLEWAIDVSSLHNLMQATGSCDAEEAGGSLPVHEIPDKDLRPGHWAMASRYVSDRVCKILLQKQPEVLRNFLAASYGESTFGVLRGNLLESYADLMQMQGGRSTVLYLDTGEEEEVELPSGPSHWFLDLSDMANQPDHVHCCPLSERYQKICFIRQPNEIAMVTENLEKGAFESARIGECFKVLRAASEEPPGLVYLTYVVPPALYPRVRQIPLSSLLDARKYRVRHRVMRSPMMRAGTLAVKPLAF